MVTNHNQPLTDDEIAALLDGTAPEALRRRVENNVAYQEQLEDAQFAAQLGSILYRFDCPSTEQLSDYHLKMMDPVSMQNIVLHLDICASCRMEIEELVEFLDDADEFDTENVVIQPSPHYTLARIYVQSVQARGSGRKARGSFKTVTAKANGLHVVLTVSEDKVGVQLAGQLASMDGTVDWEAGIVELRLEGEDEPRVTTVDDVLQFRFQQVQTTAVDIRLISTEGNIVRIEKIKLTEN